MSLLEQLRGEKNDFFRDDQHSPLTADQKQDFSGLHYFPENPELNIRLEVEEFPDKQIVTMQTTTGDVQDYERFGRFRFTVEGQEVELALFHNPHGFFLPFADSLAGKETYGAGRYLEPELLPDGRFHVDFNLSYNPYCAYNELYSCPITPGENRLEVPIRAGEMVFEKQ
jgi:uncharacterized protein (DUF1684 family)